MRNRLMKTRPIMIMIVFLLSIPAALSSTVKAVSAEKREWIEYPFAAVGGIYAVCGEECIGCARALSDSVLFFDINKSAWTELEFDAQQTIRDLKAEGHTILRILMSS